MFRSIRSAAQKMMIDFEDTRSIPHNVTKGTARESIVFETFLKPYLPARFSIGSGLIMDANNRASKQQDLVIYDDFYSPMLRVLNSDRIFFPESVFAVIEVKSNLTRKEIVDIVEKSVSVWDLSKTPHQSIVLSSEMSIPVSHTPTLCLGIAFESSLNLNDIALIIREIRESSKAENALSFICVLRDKDGDSGILLNVDKTNLGRVAIIPSSTSRLAVSRSEKSGDALLHAYLILMQHLRNCGSLFAGPDLIHYAQSSGLSSLSCKVSKTEMEGSLVDIKGRLHSVDILEKVRSLGFKVLKGVASDDEILEWFYFMPHVPSGEALIDPHSVFSENQVPIPMAGPLAVLEAIERKRKDSATDNDEMLIQQFVTLIRSIREQNRKIEMGVL